MDINSVFPSKYLKASDIDGDATFTIREVQIEDVGGDGEHKPVVYFRESERGLCLNKTNASNVASMYGSMTEGWIGKAVTLFATQTDFQGKSVPCIRVRLGQPKSSPAPSPATTPAPSQPAPQGGVIVTTLERMQEHGTDQGLCYLLYTRDGLFGTYEKAHMYTANRSYETGAQIRIAWSPTPKGGRQVDAIELVPLGGDGQAAPAAASEEPIPF